MFTLNCQSPVRVIDTMKFHPGKKKVFILLFRWDILMENNYIIHASGKVRIDRLDHLGIYNADTNRHTHKLRVIKKII